MTNCVHAAISHLWAQNKMRTLFVLPGGKLFAQAEYLAICTAGLGLGFICYENDNRGGKEVIFRSTSVQVNAVPQIQLFQSCCLPTIFLFSPLALFNTGLHTLTPIFIWKVCLQACFQSFN